MKFLCYLVLLTAFILQAKGFFEFLPDEQGGLQVVMNSILILSHSPEEPAISLILHHSSFREVQGSWMVTDDINQRFALTEHNVTETDVSVARIRFYATDQPGDHVDAVFNSTEDKHTITFVGVSSFFNAMTVHLHAEQEEKVFGGGEQFTYLNLRGKAFPIWVREGGIGRGGIISPIVNLTVEGAAGDYHTSYFPSTFFASTRGITVRETTKGHDYMVMDFSAPNYHEIYSFTQQISLALTGSATGSMKTALQDYWRESAASKWRQGVPEWVSNGIIVGVQGGTERMLEVATLCVNYSIPVAAMWIQDWSGKVETGLGSRVFWNWKWNETWYPDLDIAIQQLNEDFGIRVTGYVNPYLNIQGDIYEGASSSGYFLKSNNGSSDYIQDHGGFYAATVDLEKEEARDWYINLLTQNMVNLGLQGWMADFGEYTPVDGSTNSAGRQYHQMFPSWWAETNGEILRRNNIENEVLVWMRSGLEAGGAELQPTIWTGDQNVDFTVEDGLPSAVTGALSAGLTGIGIIHWDIGGYTSFPLALARSQELLLRSAELAMFSPIMRTHEGNRPEINAQIYDDPDTLTRFARLVNIFVAQKNYTQRLVQEYILIGKPLFRPVFLEYPEYPPAWNMTSSSYMYGDSLYISPVYESGVSTKEVHILPGTWEDIWTGEIFNGPIQSVSIEASLGYPPVLLRRDTVSEEDLLLFHQIQIKFGKNRF